MRVFLGQQEFNQWIPLQGGGKERAMRDETLLHPVTVANIKASRNMTQLVQQVSSHAHERPDVAALDILTTGSAVTRYSRQVGVNSLLILLGVRAAITSRAG